MKIRILAFQPRRFNQGGGHRSTRKDIRVQVEGQPAMSFDSVAARDRYLKPFEEAAKAAGEAVEYVRE